MTGTRVTVIGADRVAATMHAAADDLRDLDRVHGRAGALLADAAARNVRRRTGALAGSIAVTVRPGGPFITAGNAGVRYAGPIEGGWRRRHITPQRYLARAIADRGDDVIREYDAAVDAAARKVKGA